MEEEALEEDRTPSVRFERSPLGQILISALILVLLAVEIGTNLPDSSVARSVGSTSSHVAKLLGMEQAWGVFAPDPRGTSLRLSADVTFADGTHTTWHMPQGDKVISNLRYYRWRKWLERVRADDYQWMWEPTARWIADQYRDRASPVTEVQLVRTFHQNSILDPQPPWQSIVYYTLDLPPKEAGS